MSPNFIIKKTDGSASFILIILLFISLPFINYSQKLTSQPTNAITLNDGVESVQSDFQGFRENKGQVADDNGNYTPFVLFRTNIGHADLFVTEKGITYVFNRWHTNFTQYATGTNTQEAPQEGNLNGLERFRVDMELQGATITPANIIKENVIENGEINYYLAHCPNGIFDVKSYRKITIANIYPGIDWVLRSDAIKGIKHDFVVHPGGDPSKIKMLYNGAENLTITNQGNTLKIATSLGSLEEGELYTYQPGGEKINSTYVLADSLVSFYIGNYDRSRTLVIDPPLVLNWATYYGGGNKEGGRGITNDLYGNVFITGFVSSTNFPTFNAGASHLQTTNAGGVNGANGRADAFIVKFNNAGVRQWATYYGGTGDDRGEGIITDNLGNVYVTGGSSSPDMPLQVLPGAYNQATAPVSNSGLHDVMILKFTNNGARLWATYYGGNDMDTGMDLATDNTGAIYITGFAGCSNFPVRDPSGGAYFQNMYGGGPCDNNQIKGDAFVLKLDPSGALVWSTLLGGNRGDAGLGIAIDNSGDIVVVGGTLSTDFPRNNPGGTTFYQNNLAGLGGFWGDVFITKFSPTYNMLWSTYCGGDFGDVAQDVAIDLSGNIYVTGSTASTNFPVVNLAGAYNQAASGGPTGLNEYGDAFLIKFSNAGIMLWSTYYGGSLTDIGYGVITDKCENVYVTGHTKSSTFPTLNPGSRYFYDGTYSGRGYYGNAFLLGFDKNCTRTWATHYGRGGVGMHLAVDHNEKITLIGEAYNAGFALANPGGGAYFDATFNNGIDTNDVLIARFAPIPLRLTNSSRTNATCFGLANGRATITASGGVSPYSFTWNTIPPQTTATATGLAAGTYSCIVSDSNCEIDTIAITITEPPLLQASISGQGNVSCNGGNNGWARANQQGGVAPYNYSWNPSGQTSITASNLTAGTFSVIVTDNNGCTAPSTVTITQPSMVTATITSQTAVLCYGGNSGTATVTAGGGISGYNYSWSNGQTTATANGLGPVTYTVTVTDNNGCSAQASTTITQPALLQAFVPAQNNVRCYGASTGSATAGQLGGTGQFSYSWNPTGQTSRIATNLPAGTFTVIITDENGCTAQRSVTITEPPLLTAGIASQTDVLCNGNNTGSIIATVTGGNTPYNYSWSQAGQTNSLASNLGAGNYTITVTDGNACTTQATATLTQPPPLTMTLSSTPDHCLLSDGTATTAAEGGTINYLYSWSQGSTHSSISNLGAGIYSVTLTDGNGCSITNAVTVVPEQADTLQLANKSDATCNGSCNGIATLQLNSYGNQPYTYRWNTTPPQTGLSAVGLCAGRYTCTVTDGNGCKDTMSVTISQPAVLSAAVSGTAVSCFGGSDASATIQQSGGTTPYSYLWDNGQTTTVATGLSAGIVSATVTDGNGCTMFTSFTIAEPQQLAVNTNSPFAVCIGQSASLTSSPAGGTSPYTYRWNTGNNTSAITVSPSAETNYTITLTDAKGCTAEAVTTISLYPHPDVSFSSDRVAGCGPLCVTFSNTSVNTTAALWNFGDGTSSQGNPDTEHCYTNVGAYSVTLTVTDINGCTASNATQNYITVHPDPVASFTSTPQPTTILSPNVYFRDLSAGAIHWSWSFGDVSNSSSSMQHPTYTYSDTGAFLVRLVVTNEFGCRDSIDIKIRINPDFIIYVPNTFTPNEDNINDIFIPMGTGIEGEYYELLIYDRWGSIIFRSDNPAIGWDGMANGGTSKAQQDTYIWRIVLKDVLNKKHQYVGHVNLIR